MSELVIGLTIVAVGTSLPELAASVTSALKGHADMAVGAIIGSNMFNMLLVLAIPGFGGSLPIQEAVVKQRPVGGISHNLTLALAFWRWNGASGSGTLSRRVGATLLTLYVAYYGWLFCCHDITSYQPESAMNRHPDSLLSNLRSGLFRWKMLLSSSLESSWIARFRPLVEKSWILAAESS